MYTPTTVFNWLFERKLDIESVQFHYHPVTKEWAVSCTCSQPDAQFCYSVTRFGDNLSEACEAIIQALEEKEDLPREALAR